MKKLIYLFSIILICVSINGCTKKEQNQVKGKNYEMFQKDYQHVAKNFKMKNFKKTGDGETRNSCVVFPENDYFKEKKDMVNEDMMKPVKKNLFYINNKKNMMIYITHIYLEDSVEKRLMTVDLPANEYKADKKVQLPYFDEYYFCYHNTLVSLKIMRVGNSKKNSKFSDISNQAFSEYVKLLK